MANIIIPIKYTAFDQKIPTGKLPIIETSEDSMAYGTAEIQLSQLDTFKSLSIEISQSE